jgi:hypothetical protein
MTNGRGSDDWDSFDFDAWGAETAANGEAGGTNGHAGKLRPSSIDSGEEPEQDDEGRWVSQGGVLHWEAPDDKDESTPDPRAEANSHWADDDVDLPLGAPDTLRIRSAHAWLVRRRALESEAQGELLLERRRIYGPPDEEGEAGRQPRRGLQDDSPLDVALAEHQAAIEEYERLIEELGEIADHSGPARALVEYYLYLTERLAELASAPAAPAEFAARLLLVPVEDEEASSGPKRPVSPRESAEWQGRAEAVLQARRRVERVSAPEPED